MMQSDRPQAAKPTKSIFDPFNSSATGHQRAGSHLSSSTSWRDSRSLKLNQQFTSGVGGGKWMSDTVGAGSLDFGADGRTENGGWEKGAKGLRTGGQRSLWDSMQGVKVEKDTERPAKRTKTEKQSATSVVNPFTPFRRQDGTVRETSWTSHESSPSHFLSPFDSQTSATTTPPGHERQQEELSSTVSKADNTPPQIFTSLTIYINGSTAPLISDHKLKHLLSSHGARTSTALGRRTVTHVIIGRPSSSGGAGGGLAGTKIQKEIARTAGKAVKFVSVAWVVESVKAGKRLPESRFEALRLAPKGMGSAADMFRAAEQNLSRKEKG